jgi:hypothetical protein
MHKDIDKALQDFSKAMQRFRELGIVTNKKDFTCQLGEWLVASLFDGARALSGNQKDWDIIINGKKVQVKSHAKAPLTKAKWSYVKNCPDHELDELITVVFTHDYKLKEFYKTPWHIARKKLHKKSDRFTIRWNQQNKLELTHLPKQELVKLFL